MHSKQIGNTGELRVAFELTKRGYAVFAELGDLSRIDLIACIDGKLVRIQVKAISKTNGVYTVSSRKSGPNYRYKYETTDVDVFAVYCMDDDLVAWVRSEEITGENTALLLRADPPKKQQPTIQWLKEYLNLDRVIG